MNVVLRMSHYGNFFKKICELGFHVSEIMS